MSRALASTARLVRALLAFLVLSGFTAGVPWLLAATVGWPLDWIGWPTLTPVPGLTDLITALTSPWSDQMIFALLASIGWLLWLLFLRDLLLEIIEASLTASANRRGLPRPAARRRDPIRWAAAVLVGAIVGAVLFDTARAVTGATNVAGPTAADAAAHHPVKAVAAAAQPAAQAPGQNDRLQPFTVVVRAATGDSTAATAVPVGEHHHHDAGIPAWARDAPGGTCRVKTGDNLWDLAATHLGDPHRWREIYLLNRGHQQANGYALTDPDEIDVGWVLALPARHPDTRPANRPTPHHPTPPYTHPQSPSPNGAVTPPTTHPTIPSPTATRPDQHAGSTSSPAPAESSSTSGPSQSASAAPAATADHDAPTRSSSPLDGIDLPGGWITTGLGTGLLAATAMVWWRRRHRYRPTLITKPHLDDPDLVPPLAAMTRIRTSLRRTAPEALDDQPATAPTVREYQSAAVKPELPPIGPSGADLAGAADLPLATGLGLIGDGALHAARGLLVATLAAGSDDDPDAKGRAIIPAATLATLLGVSAVDLGHVDRLTVTDTEADAITALEEEIIRRSRLIADAQVADVRALRDTDVHAEPMPQLLLIAEQPPPAWTNRLITAVRLGHSVDIGAAIIGDWPTGTTLTVAADGTTGTETPRLAVLDTAAAIAMLSMLREAHGDTDIPAPAEPVDPPQPPTQPPAPPVTATDHDTEQGSRRGSEPTTPAGAGAAPSGAPNRSTVDLTVLGRPAVLHHDGQPASGIRSKAIELAVYLAVNRKGADLSDVMEALFPDANMRRASERLSTVVADLRKHIRRAAAQPEDTDTTLRQRLEPVPNTGSRYHLDPALVRVDWWTVLDQYEAAAAAPDNQQRLTHLLAAIDAAHGGLADGADYDWIDTDREVVRRHRIKLHAHAAALLADTDPHRSWLLLQQACQIDPLSEELARTTMRAAATLGDADAIRHRLKTLREALDVHGLELSDDTETLAHELLRQLQPPRPRE